MSSSKLILTLLGFVGVASLIMGATSKDESVREDYMLQFPVKAVNEKVLVKSVNTDKGVSKPQVTSLNYSDYPMNLGQSASKNNPYQASVEPYKQDTKQMLGSSSNTQSPYVSQPNYQQSTPLRSPNISLPPMIRYKPPSLNQMGITDEYKCKTNTAQLRENFTNDAANGYMGMKIDPANPNPGPDYADGNYRKVSGRKPCINPEVIDGVMVGNMTSLTATGQQEQVMVFDRPYTTTSKPGRTTLNGVRDMIRGDLPVCVDKSHQGWFMPSAKPTDLTTGALSVMAGVNESDLTLQNMLKTYGGNLSNTLGGVNWENYTAGQQTVPQMMLTAGTGINQNTSVVAFG